VPNSCPIRRRTPVNQSQPQLTFRRTQGKPPWSQDPPDTSSKLVIRQTLLGRSTSQLRETGHGGGLVSVFVSVAFVRLRSPTLRSDPVMRAGREHARTTGKPGWKACWTDSNRDSSVAEKGPVGGEPVGTARAVNGLSWTVGQARPGPTDQKVSVRSTRGALPVFRPVGFPESPPEPGVPVVPAPGSPQVPLRLP
jgi:hypothetical protein